MTPVQLAFSALLPVVACVVWVVNDGWTMGLLALVLFGILPAVARSNWYSDIDQDHPVGSLVATSCFCALMVALVFNLLSDASFRACLGLGASLMALTGSVLYLMQQRRSAHR